MRQQIHAHALTHAHKNDTQTHGTRNLAYSDNSKHTCDNDASAGRASISKVDAAHDEVTALHVEDVLCLALDDTRRGTCGGLALHSNADKRRNSAAERAHDSIARRRQ